MQIRMGKTDVDLTVHDLGNYLTLIQGNLEILLKGVAEGNPQIIAKFSERLRRNVESMKNTLKTQLDS